MTQIPKLGSTWKAAVQNCYYLGYDYFSDKHSYKTLKDELRRLADEHDEDHAVHVAMNDSGMQAAINENQGHRKLWWKIEDFFKEEMSDEMYAQFQREAVVAEDLDAAWEAGAFDALLGREENVEQVSHFYG